MTRYLPFGGYRTGSGPNEVTDRGYTGQPENMALGLYYYQARFYVPGIGRFLSADTIVPNPTNPQSLNRYSYVLNSPLNIDPTGHRECGKDCNNPLPHEKKLGLISFRKEDLWSDAEKATFIEAADHIAQALFNATNGEFNTPQEAFRAVYGGAVEVRKMGTSCATHFGNASYTCFASWKDGINVYSNANGHIEGYVMWAMHELFHGFNANAGGQPYSDLAANPIKVDGVTISPNNGNAQTLDGYRPGEGGELDRTPFVNSWDDYTVGEDFADMGANWANSSFADDSYGIARHNWMNGRMPGWIALAITHNQ